MQRCQWPCTSDFTAMCFHADCISLVMSMSRCPPHIPIVQYEELDCMTTNRAIWRTGLNALVHSIVTQLHCVALALPLQTARLEVRLCQQPPDLFKNQDLASFFSGSAALATLTIPYELALSDFVARKKKKLFKSVCCILPLLMVRVLDNYFFDDRPKIVTWWWWWRLRLSHWFSRV